MKNLLLLLVIISIFSCQKKITPRHVIFTGSVENSNANSAKISGNTTLLEEPGVEVLVEEPEGQEGFVERAPVFSPPAPKPAEPDQPEKGERSEAVQAYLDLFESALVKIGELIKTGFSKGKDFLMQSFG